MKLTKRIVLLMLIAFAAGATFPHYCEAATITVPDDYPGIQDAIDAAVAGDVVEIREGTYDQGDITMKDSVAVRAENREVVNIIGSVTAANNASLERLVIEKDVDAAVNIPSGISNFSIKECEIKSLGPGPIGTGIMINPLSSGIIVKNTVVHVGNHTDYDRGIHINQAGSENGPVTIESSTVHIAAGSLSEDTACIYSENGSNYVLRNNILTVSDTSLNAISANTDTPQILYNCVLGLISPLTLQSKGTICAAPSYADAPAGNFHLATIVGDMSKSPSIAMDSGDPSSERIYEPQVPNPAIDLGAYGNTRYSVGNKIRGDINEDSLLNNGDFAIMAQNWKKEGAIYGEGDANEDGTVSLGDLNVLVKMIIYEDYLSTTVLYDTFNRPVVRVYAVSGAVDFYRYEDPLFTKRELIDEGMTNEDYPSLIKGYGDIDGSGDVTLGDYFAWKSAYNNPGAWELTGEDIDGSGSVTVGDYFIWKSAYNNPDWFNSIP